MAAITRRTTTPPTEDTRGPVAAAPALLDSLRDAGFGKDMTLRPVSVQGQVAVAKVDINDGEGRITNVDIKIDGAKSTARLQVEYTPKGMTSSANGFAATFDIQTTPGSTSGGVTTPATTSITTDYTSSAVKENAGTGWDKKELTDEQKTTIGKVHDAATAWMAASGLAPKAEAKPPVPTHAFRTNP